MNPLTFRQYTDAPTTATYAYMTDAVLPNGGGLVRIDASIYRPIVTLAVTAGPLYSAMSFTAEQARAVAAELLAAAQAIDSETRNTVRA